MSVRILAVAIVMTAVAASSGEAKQALCFTTDDGEYPCDFVATDPDGSFEISAPGRPSFSLVMEEPGVAAGFGNYDGRNVPLPGLFLRSASDPACWVNDTTGTRICAW